MANSLLKGQWKLELWKKLEWRSWEELTATFIAQDPQEWLKERVLEVTLRQGPCAVHIVCATQIS